jgi:hypothetical protein
VQNLTPDWANVTRSTGSFSGSFDGFVAEVYLHTTAFIDLATDISDFISGGKPVSLGSNGSLPSGSQPAIFLSGPTASWHTNKGTAGGFTEAGEITTAASSPSD